MSKQERIIDAARKRFQYYGIAKTTMQEIATDAGVAVGTLYLYFRNKDELIVACAREFVDEHRQMAEQLLADDLSADEMLRRYVLARFHVAAEMRTGSRHAAELARAVLRLQPNRLREEGEIMWEVVTKLIERGDREKLFAVADPSSDAKVFLFSIACFFPNALGEPIVPPEEADLLSVVDWFVAMWKRGSRPRIVKRGARAAHHRD